MPTLLQSEFVYQSGTAPAAYRFTIVSDLSGTLAVRDIQNPYGFLISPYSQIPQSVSSDIAAAMSQVEDLMALTSAVNGTLTFSAENSKSVVFATALASADYRVSLSSTVFAPLRLTSKTVAGFTVEAGATITGTVGYDVLL